jgi:hypothetical protein
MCVSLWWSTDKSSFVTKLDILQKVRAQTHAQNTYLMCHEIVAWLKHLIWLIVPILNWNYVTAKKYFISLGESFKCEETAGPTHMWHHTEIGLTSMRWGPTTDQALITWIRGRPLRTLLSITSPTRCKSSNWKSPDRGPVLPRGDWARRGHHSFADPGVLGDPACCESVENNCACDAATSAARKLVRAWRFNFSAASSKSLHSHKYTQNMWDLRFFTVVTMKNGVFWYIKTQFVLHRRHITSLLQSPAG